MSLKNVIKSGVVIATLALSTLTVLAEENLQMATVNERHVVTNVLNEDETFWVKEGEEVTIVDEEEEIFVVKLEDDLLVYVEKEFLDFSEVEEDTKIVQGATLGDEIVTYGKQFLGTPYIYGGNSLTSGVDCSGFTTQVFGRFGINLTRSSSGQYSNNGYHISRAELQTGDLVFYGWSGRVSHVAIYAGNGQIVHASTSTRGVVMDPVDLTGMPIIGYKRVL